MARTKDRARREIKSGKSMVFRTATYARLSVDSAVTDSDSITGQQIPGVSQQGFRVMFYMDNPGGRSSSMAIPAIRRSARLPSPS